MRTLLTLLLLVIVLGHAGAQSFSFIYSVKAIPPNPSPTDTVRVVTHYALSDPDSGMDHLDTIIEVKTTTVIAGRVSRKICIRGVLSTDASHRLYPDIFDTVTIAPYGTEGYWYVVNPAIHYLPYSCNIPYSSDKDSILIGPDPSLSIGDISNDVSGCALYPNPASSSVVRITPAPSPTALLRLTDLTGRSVTFRRSGVMLYLDGIPPGLYILHIRDGERRYTTKLVKQ